MDFRLGSISRGDRYSRAKGILKEKTYRGNKYL